MPNEVTIVVRMQDATAATKAEIKAGIEEWAEGLPPVEVRASNPIDEAWQASVREGVEQAAADPVELAVTADTEAAQEQVEQAVAAMQEQTVDLAVEANTEPFSADVEAMRARVEPVVVPVEADTTALDEARQTALFGPEQAIGAAGATAPEAMAYGGMYGMAAGQLPLFGAGAPVLATAEENSTSAMNPWLAALGAPFEGLGIGSGLSSLGQRLAGNPWISALGIPFQGMFGGGSAPTSAAPEPSMLPAVSSGAETSGGAQGALTLDIAASDPINDAFIAKVKSSLKSISLDALNIPLDADTAAFAQQLEQSVQQLSQVTKADIPLEAANAIAFRENVAEQVNSISESVKAVIQVDPDSASLATLRANILAAADASAEEASAQQKLSQAMASGDPEKIAQAQAAVADAEKAATAATTELEAAQVAAAAAEDAAGAAAGRAGLSMRALNEAMGPVWMVMNVVQMAAMAMGGGFGSSASQAQDLASQIVSLGNATGSSASSMLDNNQALSDMNDNLTKIGSSSAAFAQAAQGVQSFTQYSNELESQQQALGNTMVTFTEQTQMVGRAAQEEVSPIQSVTESIAELAQQQANGGTSGMNLSKSVQDQVALYNAYAAVMPQVQQELTLLKDAQQVENDQLASFGFSMSAAAQGVNSFGQTIEQLVKDYTDATAGSKYLEDSVDKATITAGQGAQQWQQLQQAVSQAGDAYTQSKDAVANAEHGVETATQGVDSAIHAQQQSVLAVTQSQQAYTAAVYQETQAQQAVTAARAAAEQQLVSLNLQANDAAESVNAANLSLYNAQANASKYGVNTGNAQQIADTQNITSANVNQVTAAQQLVAAENALADAQNSSSQAQSTLNTARQQGVDNNPNVLAAEHSLTQSQQAVVTAAQGVTNAQYAEQQAAIQVSNSEYSLKQAHEAVAQAQQAETAALAALTTAQQNEGLSADGATRSIDANTLAGAQNRQEIENIYDQYVAVYGPGQLAAQMTENVGEKMNFTAGQVHSVIDNLDGLNGLNVQYGINGVPTLDLGSLFSTMEKDQIDPYKLGLNRTDVNLAMGPVGSSYAVGGAASGGLSWVGEDGPELVDLPPGSSVHPHANSMQMAANGDAPAMHRAAGGPIGAPPSPLEAALGVNVQMAALMSAYDVAGQAGHVLGGPAPHLPPAGGVDLGPFGNLGGSPGGGSGQLAGDRATNKAIMQQVFASFGWGSGAEWAAQDYVEMREAGYNNFAQNPTSTAFGMGQMLDSTWAAYGFQKTTDPRIQAEAMAVYERDRYGGPIGAAAHERAYNWYGAGGSAGGLIGVGEDGPELLHVPGGSTVVPHANVAGTLGAQPVQVELTVNIVDAGNSAMGSWFKQQIKTGGIQLSANGARVTVNA